MGKYPMLEFSGAILYVPDPRKHDGLKDLLHYVFVFGVICVAWQQAMSIWQAQPFGYVLELTALSTFLVFVVADGLAHKFILNER